MFYANFLRNFVKVTNNATPTQVQNSDKTCTIAIQPKIPILPAYSEQEKGLLGINLVGIYLLQDERDLAYFKFLFGM